AVATLGPGGTRSSRARQYASLAVRGTSSRSVRARARLKGMGPSATLPRLAARAEPTKPRQAIIGEPPPNPNEAAPPRHRLGRRAPESRAPGPRRLVGPATSRGRPPLRGPR